MKRIERMGNHGSRSPTGRRITIGGPRFWTAYAAAVGAGIASVPFTEWCRGRLGLPPIDQAEGEPFFGTGLVVFYILSAWFYGIWRVIRSRYQSDPDIEECRQLMLLIFAACVPHPFAIITAQASASQPDTVIAGAALLWVLVAALIPVSFAVKNPRHGFFCAAMMGLCFPTTAGAGYPFLALDYYPKVSELHLYVTPIRMAVAFLYISFGVRVQSVITVLFAVLNCCSPGMLGAVVGTISWSIRKGPAKRGKQRTSDPESVQGSTSQSDTSGADETRIEQSTDETD